MRRLLVILSIVSVAAVVVAASAVRLAQKYYLERAELRLNPVNIERYSDENSQLGPPLRRRVVFIGDSRVELWNPRLEIPDTEMVWRGIGGETTVQILQRLDNDAIKLAPASVVIQAGINDLVAGNSLGRGGQTVQSVIANLRSMADTVTRAGADVYLFTIVRPARPSWARRLVWSDSIFDDVAAVNSALRSMTSGHIIIVDADRLLQGSDQSPTLPARFSVDTLHFSAAAYELLNRELSKQMEAELHAVQ